MPTFCAVQRLRINLKGLLQGIGFRPYVYRLAKAYQLAGWVANDHDRVLIEIEGHSEQLADFLADLPKYVPACGQITELNQHLIPVTHQHGFQLKPSLNTNQESAIFACPDITVCASCVSELFDKYNRRYHYPFISCCHCGPRYSVMYGLPYDREQISLRDFPLCAACAAEYQNPKDRRFHAQTIACAECGPQLSFCDGNGLALSQQHLALTDAIQAVKAGYIVAVKGIGGFQLILDATNTKTITRLRYAKQRASKPFAIMVASLNQALQFCKLTAQEQQCLTSSVAPIVLAKAKPQAQTLLNHVAPKQALLGIMLPSSPLHHLLMAELDNPIVATSGNRNGEPICIDNEQALLQLNGLADFFLWHDRAILRPLDDSIVRVIANTPTVLRRARGYVPTPISCHNSLPTTLAVGGQLKNTVAFAHQRHILLSQHLGDLEQLATTQQQRATIEDISRFFSLKPQQVISDQHSDYVSSDYARRLNLPLQTVQHHYAHILSCMAEHQLQAPVLGVAWDGIGLGENNALWGGEFLQINKQGWQRVASCRPFPLIGGTVAIKEPRRAALGLLYAAFGDAVFQGTYNQFLSAFSSSELKLLQSMIQKQINCPMTSSIGRLFDAFASLLDLCQINEFEGQAAMALEACALTQTQNDKIYSVQLINQQLDWQPLLQGVLTDLMQRENANIAARIHHSLAAWIFAVAKQQQASHLVLSGGCFQNAYLVEAIVQAKQATDYTIFRHSTVPPNDGGLALGQIYSTVLLTGY